MSFYEKEAERKARWRYLNRERINEQNRAYKQTRGPYQPGDPKILARKKALHAVNTGKLVPQPCEVCGEFPRLHDGRRGVIAHHDDYSKPLDVRWLCTIHHGEEHRRMNIKSHRDVTDIPF